jgi:hypothetical protein
MPRFPQAMKDVAGCEKLRGGVERPMIRRCPNGATCYAEMHNIIVITMKRTR